MGKPASLHCSLVYGLAWLNSLLNIHLIFIFLISPFHMINFYMLVWPLLPLAWISVFSFKIIKLIP